MLTVTQHRLRGGGGETRAGSNPAFGTILKVKGIPVKTGVPFFV